MKQSSEFLEPIRSRASEAGILLDFDGALAEIVSHSDRAMAVAGAAEALRSLLPRYRLVAVISGRSKESVAELLPVPGLRIEGVYGLERSPGIDAAQVEAATTVEGLDGAWCEPKGASIAVHFRETDEPEKARAALRPRLEAVASANGLEVIEGKMVLELVPRGAGRKGSTVRRLAAESRLRAALYAGDDIADVEAFEALDELAVEGLATLKVAVLGSEAPAGLAEAADVGVEGPAGLVRLLNQLG